MVIGCSTAVPFRLKLSVGRLMWTVTVVLSTVGATTVGANSCGLAMMVMAGLLFLDGSWVFQGLRRSR
jgi:hypothetical protein